MSDRTRQCRRYAIKGSTVCPTHGASAGQVRRTARQRLNALAEPAIVALEKVLERVERDPNIAMHPSILRAAQLVLDRAGYGPSAKLELEHTPNNTAWVAYLNREEKRQLVKLIEVGKARAAGKRPPGPTRQNGARVARAEPPAPPPPAPAEPDEVTL